jgi:hypothetical protein
VVRSGLRKHVYGGELGPGKWPTLRTLIRARRQVIMLSHHSNWANSCQPNRGGTTVDRS